MSIIFEERLSDAPYVETITHGHTLSSASIIRPAESNWHLVLVKEKDHVRTMLVGAWATAGVVSYNADAEILWIRFKLGTFMPHLPAKQFLNTELLLPEGAGKTFYLNGSTWQFPDFENADTFLNRLVRQEILVRDPVVDTVLQEQPANLADRTIRHRFLHSTGLTRNHIFQIERAKQAAALLREGKSILDTVHEAGYYDQPHLTRALKQWVGHTPTQIVHIPPPE
jgi:AraC-like DNA-binding protein